jgi:hypothetical protein
MSVLAAQQAHRSSGTGGRESTPVAFPVALRDTKPEELAPVESDILPSGSHE